MAPRPTLALLILAAAAPALAVAQDRPPMQPTRDVSITYRMLGPRDFTLHMSVQASTGLTRVDNPSQQGYGIVDRRNHKMTMVMADRHAYMEMPTTAGEQRSPEFDPTARFTRHGTATVAGLSCTVWEYTSEHGSGSACFTDDGVLLRSQSGANQRGMEATEVSYVSRPDADFRPPPDFVQQPLPTGGPAPGMPPGGRPPGAPPPK